MNGFLEKNVLQNTLQVEKEKKDYKEMHIKKAINPKWVGC